MRKRPRVNVVKESRNRVDLNHAGFRSLGFPSNLKEPTSCAIDNSPDIATMDRYVIRVEGEFHANDISGTVVLFVQDDKIFAYLSNLFTRKPH
jgi:hypothetical protein